MIISVAIDEFKSTGITAFVPWKYSGAGIRNRNAVFSSYFRDNAKLYTIFIFFDLKINIRSIAIKGFRFALDIEIIKVVQSVDIVYRVRRKMI